MSFLKGLWALVTNLPELVALVTRTVRLYKKAVAEGWAQEFTDHSKKVENAETDEERRRLVDAGSDILRKPNTQTPGN